MWWPTTSQYMAVSPFVRCHHGLSAAGRWHADERYRVDGWATSTRSQEEESHTVSRASSWRGREARSARLRGGWQMGSRNASLARAPGKAQGQQCTSATSQICPTGVAQEVVVPGLRDSSGRASGHLSSASSLVARGTAKSRTRRRRGHMLGAVVSLLQQASAAIDGGRRREKRGEETKTTKQVQYLHILC